jgi:hypothetical protein
MNLFVAALVVKIPTTDVLKPWVHGGVMLLANLVLIGATALILNRSARGIKEAPALKQIAAVER